MVIEYHSQIPLAELVAVARRKRDRAVALSPDAPRFRVCEANHVAQLDAVVAWLESIPGTEWFDEYLERPRRNA